MEGYLFCHKKLRRFSKNIYQLKFRGRIVAHQYCEDKKRVMLADPTLRLESAAPHEQKENLILENTPEQSNCVRTEIQFTQINKNNVNF